MSKHLTPIDISNIPDLIRLVEEVKTTNQPQILKQNSETVAMLMPMGTTVKPRKNRMKPAADYKAFRFAAGNWKDVDVEKFKAEMYESRRLSTRPHVKL